MCLFLGKHSCWCWEELGVEDLETRGSSLTDLDLTYEMSHKKDSCIFIPIVFFKSKVFVALTSDGGEQNLPPSCILATPLYP